MHSMLSELSGSAISFCHATLVLLRLCLPATTDAADDARPSSVGARSRLHTILATLPPTFPLALTLLQPLYECARKETLPPDRLHRRSMLRLLMLLLGIHHVA